MTHNVEVNESAGQVMVCIRKEGETIEDVVLNIQTRERIPAQANNAKSNQLHTAWTIMTLFIFSWRRFSIRF